MKTAFCKYLLLSGLVLMAPAAAGSDYPAAISQLISEACKFYDEGKYSSARMQFNEALRQEPNCPDAYNGLGLCAAKEGNLEQSNGCYLTAIKLKPDYYNALFNLANNYYMSQNYSESISFYLRALKVREQNGKQADADLLASLASVYRDRALTLSGLYRQQDMERALDFYHRAIKQNPEHPQAHAMLGRLYFDWHQYAVAEKELRAAISLRPTYAYAYFILGQLYVQKKELPSALVAFHNSLKYETVEKYKAETTRAINELGIPSAVIDHFAQGYEELNAGAWEAARSEFEAAAANKITKAIALNNVGYAIFRSGQTATAIDSYRRAQEASPHGIPELYYNLGSAYLQTNRLAEAEQAFKQCLTEAHGNHFLAHNALGIILKTKGDLNESLNHYNLALMQSGGSLSVVQFNRGLVLEKLGKKSEAAECYKKYIQASPSGLNAAAAREKLARLK
jgi:tetratricopeptide (TPR) repeat protein